MESWLKRVQIQPQNGNAVNSEEVALQRVGRELYELIFEPYTIKQWNKEPRELGPSVLSRIPVRINHDDRYFTDPHQALPSRGYTRIFERMFSSPSITVRLNTDYFDVRKDLRCSHVYFTGPIDAYFAHQGLPKLEYRSLEFERKVYRDTAYYQPKAHVNYPAMMYNFTRAIEYKHILQQKSPHTVVFFERSTDVGEPYYPVPNKENHELYAKYQRMAEQEEKIDFVGRLANYKYFNMDETILNALELFDQQFSGAARNCTPGKFSTVEQWKALFPSGPHGMGLRQKALVFTPVGRSSATTINSLIENMGTDHYHFLLLRYDDFDWTGMKWYEKVEWEDQQLDEYGHNLAAARLPGAGFRVLHNEAVHLTRAIMQEAGFVTDSEAWNMFHGKVLSPYIDQYSTAIPWSKGRNGTKRKNTRFYTDV